MNNKKILIFSDIHFNKDEGQTYRLEGKFDSVKQIASLVKERDIDTVFFLGDYWTNRKNINIETLDYGFKAMELLSKVCKVYCITGNHDLYLKNNGEIHSVYMFKHISNVTVFDNYESITFGDTCFHFFPHYSEDNVLLEKVQNSKTKKDKKNVGLMHQCLFGVHGNNGFVIEKGIKPSNFNKYFDLVLSGDIHKSQWLNKKFFYVGAPLPQNFNDINIDFGVHIIDTETCELEFVKLKYRKFLVVNYNNIIDNVDSLKNNIVRIDFPYEESLSLDNIKKTLRDIEKEYNIKDASYKIIDSDKNNDETVVGVEQFKQMKMSDFVKEYIKTNKPDGFDDKKLLNIYNEILTENGE
jgi:DNA repair exonuclease SbcCD nuclease subunit